MAPHTYPSGMAPHLRTGARGEHVALRFIRQKRYRLIARNVRIGRDEIDMIAFDPHEQLIVFLEVKTRSNYHEDYDPSLNFTQSKCDRMRRSARTWVEHENYEGGYRLDVVFVADDHVIRHLMNAGSDDATV